MGRWSPGYFRLTGLIVLALALSTTGCGPTLHSVTGKVMVNNKPAVGALVMLFPEGGKETKYNAPSGTVGEDGTFTLSTGGSPGAPAGKYVVTIIWLEQSSGPGAEEKANPPAKGVAKGGGDRLKGAYAKADKSKLRAEINGETTLEPFNLKQ
jgi:hypothetical protein